MEAEKELMNLLGLDGERVISTCQSLVRIPSEDPPGDTRQIAGFLYDLFKQEGVDCELVAPQKHMPNVVATINGNSPGKHVVFNGHIDTFPVGDKGQWSYDPFGGIIENGKLYGRGSADMKGGLAALIHAGILLNKIRDKFPGRITITCVADEEVMGDWGSKYLLKNRPDIRGDVLINGEPSSLDNVRVGEKGQFWFRFKCRTEGGHAAYSELRPNAIKVLIGLLQEISAYSLEKVTIKDSIREMMEEARECFDHLLCPGATDAALKPSVNIGKIAGGLSVNMIAEESSAEVDFRLPPGEKGARLRDWLESIIKRFPQCSFEEFSGYDGLLTEPDHPFVRIAKKTAEETIGRAVYTTYSLGGTEARLWRAFGTPAISYGPNHHNMGSPDEYIEIEELPQVLQVHALTALRFLKFNAL